MDQVRPEAQRFVREEDVEDPFCNCASRKCAPHQCRASIWGRVTIGLLLAYLIAMHSFWAVDRQQLLRVWETEWQGDVKRGVGMTLQDFKEAFLSEMESASKDLLAERRHLAEVVQRARDVVWALQTPEADQALEVRDTIRQLQQTSHAHPQPASPDP